LISFNNSIDFVQQFHWFCLAILSVLFGNSVSFVWQFRQFCLAIPLESLGKNAKMAERAKR